MKHKRGPNFKNIHFMSKDLYKQKQELKKYITLKTTLQNIKYPGINTLDTF